MSRSPADLPGHIAGPLCSTFPHFCASSTNASCPIVALDPSNEAWWAWLAALVGEPTEIFPDVYFHGGADEFHPDCWITTRTLLSG